MPEKMLEHTLSLSTPDLNRLKYLVGIEIASYVKSERIAEYDGENAFLVYDRPVTDEEPVYANHVLRSAQQEEYDGIVFLKERLNNIWSTSDEFKRWDNVTLNADGTYAS